jgi:hypothetical protein
VSGYPFGGTPSPTRPRPRRSRRLVRVGLALLVVAGVFVLGVALGKALEDGPSGGGTVTYVRTLTPLPQQPTP